MGRLSFWRMIGLACVFCAAGAVGSPGQTFTLLYSFDGTHGAQPNDALVQATDGNFYGTSYRGGTNSLGGIFKITPAGTLTTLYNFCAQTGCPDGYWPAAGLVQGSDGNFYGTTEYGGAMGSGTVFKITPASTLTTLHSFCSTNCTDGELPLPALIQATDGKFYGTTFFGGTDGVGAVFEITPAGRLTTLFSFDDIDGQLPFAGLVQATDGNFYGTTTGGGTYGGGTVFQLTRTGTLTTLYRFCAQPACADGEMPDAGLVQATDGNFYGTTYYGGAYGSGTVFQLTPTGTLNTLHSFDGADGSLLYAGLVQGTDGNFYGTTLAGGANLSCTLGTYVGCGTIFEITPGGTLTTLHSFDGGEGTLAYGGLLQGTDGNFYGTTWGGGANGDGTVFSLSVGLGRFVKTLPAFGHVGQRIAILGTNLTGSTSVTFNGAPASFTVVPTGTAIKTTVPAGATTGFVTVTTPGGVLKSNVKFRVH